MNKNVGDLDSHEDGGGGSEDFARTTHYYNWAGCTAGGEDFARIGGSMGTREKNRKTRTVDLAAVDLGRSGTRREGRQEKEKATQVRREKAEEEK